MDFFESNENEFIGPTYEEWLAQISEQETLKAQAIASALEKLTNLGLTLEEAKAVIGIG